MEKTGERLRVHIDRLARRRLRCGLCRLRCREVHRTSEERAWRDLPMRKLSLLCYRPRRVKCRRCGVRVDAFTWAEPSDRVITPLANAVSGLAQ